MAFAQVHPGDLIQSQNLNQIVNALNGTSGDGQPVLLVALNDPNNYALTVQNLDPTNCRGLLVLKNDGTTLLSAGCNGVTLGSPLTLPTDLQIPNANLGPDVARANLLTNGGFEIWQRGNGPFTGNFTYSADKWTQPMWGTDVISTSREANTANVDAGSVCAAAVTFTLGSGGGNSALMQKVANGGDNVENGQLIGRTVSLSVRVKASVANAVRVCVSGDGTPASGFASGFHPGDGTYHTLTCSGVVSGEFTTAYVAVNFSVSGTFYIDNACLVVGSQAANYVPLHPADDLARCQRYYKRYAATSTIPIPGGQAYSTGGFVATLLMAPQLAVVPTCTISSPGDWQISAANLAYIQCSSLSANVLHAQSCQLIGGVASGLVAGNATNLQNVSGNSWLAFEANP